ncbi:MAG: hypothetical protein VX210_10880, partial [Myxococcota bacterium]|nr:hypothetical protein [Myxococcota bacterium]
MEQGLHGFAPSLQFLETAVNCHSQNRSLTKIDNSPRQFRRKRQDLVENLPNKLLALSLLQVFWAMLEPGLEHRQCWDQIGWP